MSYISTSQIFEPQIFSLILLSDGVLNENGNYEPRATTFWPRLKSEQYAEIEDIFLNENPSNKSYRQVFDEWLESSGIKKDIKPWWINNCTCNNKKETKNA